MSVNNIKIFLKMKNKGQMCMEKNMENNMEKENCITNKD